MSPWRERVSPPCIERRFEFDNYSSVSSFLERLGELSKTNLRFPDISFGTSYVNITLRPDEERDEYLINESDYEFAAEIDTIYYK